MKRTFQVRKIRSKSFKSKSLRPNEVSFNFQREACSDFFVFKTKEIFSKMAGLMMGPVNTSAIGTVMNRES